MKQLSWANVVILPVGLAALGTCWLSLWQHWVLALGGFEGPTISPVVMMVMLLVSLFITRWAVAGSQSNLQLQGPQRLLAVCGLVAVALVLWLTFGAAFPFDFAMQLTQWQHFISPQLLALGVAGWLWWQGIHLGRDEDLHATAQREFSGGIVALAALFICNKLNPQLDAAEAFWPVIVFFGLGLGSLALAGFEQDRAIQAGSAGVGLGVNRHWLATAGLVIGCILTGAVMVAALAVPETIAVLDPVLDWIGVTLINIIGTILYGLALVFLPLGEMLGRLIWSVLNLFINLGNNLQLRSLGPSPEQVNALAQSLARTPPFRAIEIVIGVLVMLVLFRLAVRRLRLLRRLAGDEDQHETILTRDLLLTQLKTLFRARKQTQPAPTPPYLALEGAEGDPRLRVRAAYQAFLEWAARHNQARLPHQTPEHLAQALGQALPQHQQAVALLTRIYSQARYGLSITADEAVQAQTALQQVTQEARAS